MCVAANEIYPFIKNFKYLFLHLYLGMLFFSIGEEESQVGLNNGNFLHIMLEELGGVSWSHIRYMCSLVKIQKILRKKRYSYSLKINCAFSIFSQKKSIQKYFKILRLYYN